MKKVKNNKTIEVIIPINDITTIPELQNLILQGLILELETERLIDENGVEFKKIYFNNIDNDLLYFFLLKDYVINLLNGKQTPYVYIEEDLLVEKPSFLDDEDDDRSLEEYLISYVEDIENEMIYVEIGSYINGSRGSYTQNEELKKWGIEYGLNKVLITDKKTNIE
jgi:hypothetical protein